MDSHDRYVLAIAMLDGDRDARKVLADLLEEEGDRGLAQWARQGRSRPQQRIDFALMLLPCTRTIQAGATMLEMAYNVMRGVEVAKGCTLLVNRWCQGELESVQILVELCNRTGKPPGERWWDRRMFDAARAGVQDIAEAIQCAIQAESHWRQAIPNLAVHWENQAKLCIRTAVKQSQRVASPNIDWQTEYLKQAFQHLLSPADHPWPK